MSTPSEITTIPLRIPKGLWTDLEESIIQQDRQFLTEVARSLNLSVREVMQKCLGSSGTRTAIPVLWAPASCVHDPDSPGMCPWWDCHGDGLWRPCPRSRLSPSLPCFHHERSVPCPRTRLRTDPLFRAIRTVIPVQHDGALFWIDPLNRHPAFHEDGTVVTDGRFIVTSHRGKQIILWHSASVTKTTPPPPSPNSE